MAVYVDNYFVPYRRMLMSHMVADTLDELHHMAFAIGIHCKHFQGQDPRRPHYDICKSKRELAIKFGAKPISSKELVLILRRNYGHRKT